MPRKLREVLEELQAEIDVARATKAKIADLEFEVGQHYEGPIDTHVVLGDVIAHIKRKYDGGNACVSFIQASPLDGDDNRIEITEEPLTLTCTHDSTHLTGAGTRVCSLCGEEVDGDGQRSEGHREGSPD